MWSPISQEDVCPMGGTTRLTMLYSESKSDWLKTFLTLPEGVPSHDTFRRVFCLRDPLAFQACFSDWMAALMTRHGLTPLPLDRPRLTPVAIDGKTQRG